MGRLDEGWTLSRNSPWYHQWPADKSRDSILFRVLIILVRINGIDQADIELSTATKAIIQKSKAQGTDEQAEYEELQDGFLHNASGSKNQEDQKTQQDEAVQDRENSSGGEWFLNDHDLQFLNDR